MRRVVLLFALALAGAASCLQAQNGDLKAALQQKLNQTFVQTKFRSDWSDIVQAGSIVVLQKDGLMMYQATVPSAPITTYKNGKLSQGFGDSFAVDMADGMNRQGGAASIPRKTLVTGEKCWVNTIIIGNNEVDIRLVTDAFNDGRYFGFIKFPFPKKSTPTPDEVLGMIGEVLTVDNSQAAQQPPPPPQQPQPPAPQALAPVAPPPPPPDAAAPAPQTISLGQTKDQVVAILGQPQKIVQLGAKEIDIYPDMKVTFVNGKVSDVE